MEGLPNCCPNSTRQPAPPTKLTIRMSQFSPIEESIADIRRALDTGQTTAVELVQFYLDRIAKYDHVDPGERSADALAKANAEGRKLGLNSIPVLSKRVLEDAGASDARRAAGKAGPLEGIPFTVKDSYMAEGLTVANGSPAFERLVAQWDAFTVARLRAAGAILIGKTNMPPMADGGMQRVPLSKCLIFRSSARMRSARARSSTPALAICR